MKPKPKYWETPEFRALKADWYRRLGESGFDDIEWPNGHEWIKDHGRAVPNTDLANSLCEAGAPSATDLMAAGLDSRNMAREALDDPAIWTGLPKKAREIWTLVAVHGMSLRRACEVLNLSVGGKSPASRWIRLIQDRIRGA